MHAHRDEIRASAERAFARPDESWYRHLLAHDATGCSLSAEEVDSILRRTIAVASEMAEDMAQTHGALSPQTLAQALRLDVVPMREEACTGPLPLLGLFQPAGRQIMLNENALQAIEAFIATYALESITPAGDLRACVMYHEIFHAVEESTAHIFTRSAMLRRKLFGVIPVKRGLASASEIGAIHFSRLMAKTRYSPCIFGEYLLALQGRAGHGGLTPEDANSSLHGQGLSTRIV